MGAFRITVAKWILVIINVFALVLGVSCIVVGSIAAANMPLGQGYGGAIVFILAGILILLFSLVGIVGALKEAPKLLLVYCIVVGLLTITIIGVCVSAFTLGGMVSASANYVWAEADNTTRNAYEAQFECCGWDVKPPVDQCSIGSKAKGPCQPIFVGQVRKVYIGIAVTALILALILIAAIVFAAIIRFSALKQTSSFQVA